MSAKPYAERKTEIVNTAMTMFFSQGYENTTVAQIIDAIGIAKGTFYHYFAGKEDLLEEIVERRSEEAIRELSVIVEDPTLSATEKIARYFREAISWKSRNRDLTLTAMRVLYRDENLRLRRRMLEGGVVRVAPIIAEIVREGIESGEFTVTDANFSGDFLIRSITAQNERLGNYILENEDSPDLVPYLKRYFDSLERVVERILGLPQQTLYLADRDSIAALFGPTNQDEGDRQ